MTRLRYPMLAVASPPSPRFSPFISFVCSLSNDCFLRWWKRLALFQSQAAHKNSFHSVALNTHTHTHIDPLMYIYFTVCGLSWNDQNCVCTVKSTLFNRIIIIVIFFPLHHFHFSFFHSMIHSMMPVPHHTIGKRFNFLLEIECLIFFFNAIILLSCSFWCTISPILLSSTEPI